VKGDWPKLTILHLQDETITIDGLKCLMKGRFALKSLDLVCENEEWMRRLVPTKAEFITVFKSVTLYIKALTETGPFNFLRLSLFINQIAKKESIDEHF